MTRVSKFLGDWGKKSEKTLYIARNLNHAPFRKIVVTLQRFRDNLDKIFESRQNVLREKRQTNRTVEKFDDRLTPFLKTRKKNSTFPLNVFRDSLLDHDSFLATSKNDTFYKTFYNPHRTLNVETMIVPTKNSTFSLKDFFLRRFI